MAEFFSLSFEKPDWLWLLLTIPVMAALSWRALCSLDPLKRYISLAIRSIVVLLLVLCLAGIAHVRTNKNLTVLFLLDRSNSIPKEKYAEQEQYIYEAVKDMPKDDKVGVLTFDGQSYVEQLPMRGGVFFDVLPATSLPDRTDMAGAMRMAMALFPHDTAKRIVLVTDGNNNVGNVLDEIRSAKANGIGVDVLPMYYLHTEEVYVEKLVVPASAKEGDMIPLRAIITSRKSVSGTVSLTDNGVPVELSEDIARVRLRPGQNPFFIKLPVHGSVAHRFELTFRPDNDSADTIVENNKATAFTFVGGEQKVLLLTGDIADDAELVRALRKEKINVEAVNVEDAQGLDLLRLMQFSTVILANVGANWFTDEQHKAFATYVRDMGHGLIMTGGPESFGAGGWIGTPLERIMPVDFEIKHRQVIPRGALVIIMHSCEMPRGNYWGKRVAEKAVDTISSKDYFGLLSFSHMKGIEWSVPMAVATSKTAIKQRIQRMSNGDMPDFRRTMEMAVDALMECTDAAQRHVIIISDGDAQPPSKETIQYMKEKKITCSAVAIGYGAHVQEAPLRKIAKDTGGRFYAVRNPKKLPQIFVKESKVIRRPLIMETPFTPQLNYAMSDLWVGFGTQADIPPLGGLVMTSPKQDGMIEMPLIRKTSDGDDPVLAHWQIGLGRTVAFTSGYWTHWGQEWTDWASFGKLWAQIVTWTMNPGKQGNFDVVTKLEGNQGRIIVNALDENSNYMNFLDLQARVVKPVGMDVEIIKLVQTGPGQYEAKFPVNQTGQFVASLFMTEGDDTSSIGHTGLSVPYSPEYKELSANVVMLEKITDISGGKELGFEPEADGVFRHDLPPTRSHQPAWEWVLAWLLLPLFLMDVAFRRLASTVAVSIFVEVVLDVVLLFGFGIADWPGFYRLWGIMLVLLVGEIVGWTIRFRAIMPSIEFFTHSVVALGGAGEASAGALTKLKDTRERVQESRTAEGAGQKIQKLKRSGDDRAADSGARYDVGDEQAKEKVGDIRDGLGDAAAGQAEQAGQPQDKPTAKKPPKIADDFTSRLLAARKRARDEMDDKKDRE